MCEGTGSTGPSVLSAAGAIGRQEYAFFFTVCAKLLMPTEPVDLAVVEVRRNANPGFARPSALLSIMCVIVVFAGGVGP